MNLIYGLFQPRHRALPLAGVGYMPQLDGIRALALFAVLIDHWYGHFPPIIRIIGSAFDSSSLGVHCFFVLSGFLITQILLTTKSRSTKVSQIICKFYLRRILRIFPIYYLVLLIAWVVLPTSRDSMPWHVLYLTNVKIMLDDTWPDFGGHFWSLAVEEQFYLFWPFIVLLSNVRIGFIISIALCTVAPVFRIMTLYMTNESSLAIYVSLINNIDLLCMGAVLAYIKSDGNKLIQASMLRFWGLTFLLSYLIIQYLLGGMFAAALGRSMLGLSFAVFIAIVSINSKDNMIGRILSSQLLLTIGIVSYGGYIFHPYVPGLMASLFMKFDIDLMVGPYYLRLPIFLCGLFAISWFSYIFIEAPIRNWGCKKATRHN